jgi:Uma2 family endonuclease
MTALTLNFSSLVDRISDRELEMLSRDNPDAQLEINSHGHLIFMSPTGGETGNRNLRLAFQVELWNERAKLGKVFDSSTGFRLSNNAVRSPDVSWIPNSKWNALTLEQKRKYLTLDPDFVIELMSPSDYLSDVQSKMREYIDCGVRLGWLINPDERKVEIYRQGRETEVLDNPQTLKGEDIMSGLVVSLEEIFD